MAKQWVVAVCAALTLTCANAGLAGHYLTVEVFSGLDQTQEKDLGDLVIDPAGTYFENETADLDQIIEVTDDRITLKFSRNPVSGDEHDGAGSHVRYEFIDWTSALPDFALAIASDATGMSAANVSISGRSLIIDTSGVSTPAGSVFMIDFLSPVPEGKTYALLLAGLSLLGLAARRQKRVGTTPA